MPFAGALLAALLPQRQLWLVLSLVAQLTPTLL
jgi:hypothetical protein